jgi:hypothetical protein
MSKETFPLLPGDILAVPFLPSRPWAAALGAHGVSTVTKLRNGTAVVQSKRYISGNM